MTKCPILPLKTSRLTAFSYISNPTNCIFKFNSSPNPWKTSIICPIPKPRTILSKPTNYRPISLLPSLSKVIECVIRTQLQDYIQLNNIIIPEEFGFRIKYSTQHQLLCVVEFLREKLNKKLPGAATFLDIAKVFDKVWYEGLTQKLIKLKFRARLLYLMHSYLCDAAFLVRIKNLLSTIFIFRAGIVQVRELVSILFKLFFNHIRLSLQTYVALYEGLNSKKKKVPDL